MTVQLRALISIGFLLVTFAGTACAPVIRPEVRNGAGQWLPLWNEAVSAVTEVANIGNPVDAAPSPDGSRIYFTSTGDATGVYVVDAAGGEPQALLVGAPLVAPQGLAVSADDRTLFVADAGAGHLWSIPSAGGTATPIAGTEATNPVAVEVAPNVAGELVYFAGSQAGTPTIWQVAASGGEASIVAQGAPLVNPMGLAIAQDGTVYVVDTGDTGTGQGTVLRIAGKQIEPMASDFRAGYQAGAALTLDESVLLVSALDTQGQHAQVLLINLATGEQGIVTKVVAANAGSGGIHRAHTANLFAWADYLPVIQKPGHVYVVRP